MKLPFEINIPKRRLIGGIVIVVCVVLWCVLQFVRVRMTAPLSDLRGAERFAPEGGYAQISCYFTDTAGITMEREREFAWLVEDLLTRNAIEANEDARLFVDCYTTNGRVHLTHGTKNADAEAIGTGGDFFLLHPVELVSGMYYSADALTDDQVLIDESLAWQLFGGMDIAGQTVNIGGVPHVIRGVVKTADGRMRKAAGASEALVYLSAESLAAYGAAGQGEVTLMDCYEVVMPDPVRDFAVTQIREAFKMDETQMEIVNQTVRFNNLPLLSVLRSFGTRSMTNIAMWYPYWENVARGTEDILVIVMALQAFVIALPVVILTVWIVNAYRHKKWTARGVFHTLGDHIYATQSRLRSAK